MLQVSNLESRALLLAASKSLVASRTSHPFPPTSCYFSFILAPSMQSPLWCDVFPRALGLATVVAVGCRLASPTLSRPTLLRFFHVLVSSQGLSPAYPSLPSRSRPRFHFRFSPDCRSRLRSLLPVSRTWFSLRYSVLALGSAFFVTRAAG